MLTGDAVAALDPGWHPDNLAGGLLVQPGSTAEVAAVVEIARAHGAAIVPQGGRTGLVGGGITRSGEIALSLSRMNRIVRLDPLERTATVEAGAILETVAAEAALHGLEIGIDLAARGSATIGGMISTNAGGVLAHRYGVMRHRVLGLEAVMPDGSVLSDLTRIVKVSAGYDLKHLLIGAEGTLGVVTRVVLKLEPLPAATLTALFSLPSVDAVHLAVDAAGRLGSARLRMAEAMWKGYFDLTSAVQGWQDPAYDHAAPLHLALMIEGESRAALEPALLAVFEAVSDAFPGAGGLVSSSVRQDAEIWRLREDTEAVYRQYPMAPSYDVSLPLSEIEGYLEELGERLGVIDPDLSPFVFGHLADGNLHILMNRPGPLAELLANAIDAAVYRGLGARGGSFSAEHGVGSKRVGALRAHGDPVKLALMAALKAVVDPDNLMNPGKVVAPAAADPERMPSWTT
ncbi:FAD-binding oxidoreductase [Methylobrevis pamukkalensis]|uniref:Putative FAD-linked oxidoreductase n=1 Tax=Methylobrevis pamukkalensis TaxID=1439726 RepID=A0A1E3H8B3_9HYPH|nr:FAD-binding oxidoreductase [Methylobrevis pamukkalensis]ODN72395.1 putative FAD-linked oxidoreductase [Methylobrevis pamukkalensis]